MSDRMLARVFDKIDADDDYVVRLLQEMVRIPTVNPKFVMDHERNREGDFQELLKELLTEIGFTTELYEVFPDRPNLLATWPGSSDRSLVLNGHVDVVPEGTQSEWLFAPFDGVISEQRVYGRGALDMKGGLAAYVAALTAIRRAGITLRGRLDVHAVVDEEAGGFGSRAIVENGYRAKAALISEPTWEALNPAEGGIEWVRVTILGKSGHAGWRYNSIYPQPDPQDVAPSVNAIDLGVRLLSAIRDYERERGFIKKHPLFPPGLATINPGAILAGAGINEDGLPGTTSNPAIVPDIFVADFDLKFLPSETSINVRKEFEQFIKAFADTIPWLRSHPPKVQWELGNLRFPGQETSASHPLIQSIIKTREYLGCGTKIAGFVAVSDAGHYGGAGIPSVLYGPSGDGLHGLNEYVDIASLKRCVKVIAAAAISCCGAEKEG